MNLKYLFFHQKPIVEWIEFDLCGRCGRVAAMNKCKIVRGNNPLWRYVFFFCNEFLPFSKCELHRDWLFRTIFELMGLRTPPPLHTKINSRAWWIEWSDCVNVAPAAAPLLHQYFGISFGRSSVRQALPRSIQKTLKECTWAKLKWFFFAPLYCLVFEIFVDCASVCLMSEWVCVILYWTPMML